MNYDIVLKTKVALLKTTDDATVLASIIYAVLESYQHGHCDEHGVLTVLRSCRDGNYHRWLSLTQQVPEIPYLWDEMRERSVKGKQS